MKMDSICLVAFLAATGLGLAGCPASDDVSTTGSTETGDGDGDPATGDGDGDPTTGDGDGDPTGDGDGDPTGDGDGDPTTGDGDGDPTGDGDGDPTTGDGDGDGTQAYGPCTDNDPSNCLDPNEDKCVFDTDPDPFNVCSQNCESAADCPVPAGDYTATVSCLDIFDPPGNECYLQCFGGATCPDGMTCFGDVICGYAP